MKKLVLILVALSGVLMSCDSPVSDPEVVDPQLSFQGTWDEDSRTPKPTSTLQFISSNFIFSYDNSYNGKGSFSGPFSYTETTITFNPNEGVPDEDLKYIPWTQNYEIYINDYDQIILFIEPKWTYDGQNYMIGGRYIKQ